MTATSEMFNKAIETLRSADLDGREGLPEGLFLFISSLVPLPNVDLLVTNNTGQLLLIRRNDGFFQPSWHIPGGCMRFGESFEHRVQQTALHELGCSVYMEPQPIAVRNVIRGPNPKQQRPNERGHNVAILFRCAVPEDYKIENGLLQEWENGYCKWFDQLPEDFMEIQDVYMDVLYPWTSGGEIL